MLTNQRPCKCPQCNSPSATKVSLIYESGTVISTQTGSFSGSLNGDVIDRVHGKLHAKTQQITKLAKRVAPPQRKEVGKAYKYGTVGSIISAALIGRILDLSRGLLILMAIPTVAICLYCIKKKRAVQAKYEREVYLPEFRKWNQSFMCNQCGFIYEFNMKASIESDINAINGQG